MDASDLVRQAYDTHSMAQPCDAAGATGAPYLWRAWGDREHTEVSQDAEDAGNIIRRNGRGWAQESRQSPGPPPYGW
jgi:hypothetical protein